MTVSQWTYDHKSGVLFTAEAFGHYHDPDTRELTLAELNGGVPDEHLRRFYLDKLPFINYLNPDASEPPSSHCSTFSTSIHGNAVDAADINNYLADVMRTVQTPAAER